MKLLCTLACFCAFTAKHIGDLEMPKVAMFGEKISQLIKKIKKKRNDTSFFIEEKYNHCLYVCRNLRKLTTEEE